MVVKVCITPVYRELYLGSTLRRIRVLRAYTAEALRAYGTLRRVLDVIKQV